MIARASARYFVASVVLLAVVVALYAVSTARRTQAELRVQLEQKAIALADAVEAGSRHAVRSNALVEQMIGERLLDNARLIDALLARPLPPGSLQQVAQRNGLRRVDLLDLDGRPWTPPPPIPDGPDPGRERPMPMMPHGPRWRDQPPGEPPMMPRGGAPMMPGMQADGPTSSSPMMPFMWGRRWRRMQEPGEPGGPPPTPPMAAQPGPNASGPASSEPTPEKSARPAVPPVVRDRKFWEGSVFGVAIGATSFRGVIAVHADAAYVLNFRREMGVDRQLAEIGRQAGVTDIRVIGPDLTVLADASGTRVGERVDDAAIVAVAARPAVSTRLIDADAGHEARFEVVRPIALEDGRTGLLAIALSTEPMTRAWWHDVRAGAFLAIAVLLMGGVGLGAIFWVQRRHLAEMRRLEGEMERRERLAALGDVAAAFAHEVRNPLNAVSMGLQRLRAEFAPAPVDEYAHFVDLMQGEVRRLNGIVEEFIGLARPVAIKTERFAVDDLLRELSVLVEAQARAAGISVSVSAPAIEVVADRDQIKQVLLNLALNAIQAMHEGGALTLGAQGVADGVRLTVADTGPGIPPEVRARIFDPYFSTRPEGLGLGLTIARRLVEAHGGAIEIERSDARGTRFAVTLPGLRS